MENKNPSSGHGSSEFTYFKQSHVWRSPRIALRIVQDVALTVRYQVNGNEILSDSKCFSSLQGVKVSSKLQTCIYTIGIQ